MRAEDLVDRDFTASEPNELWCTDFTYVRTWSGWVYVAFIVDVYSRLIVSWHAQTAREADLVTTPLRMALWWRRHQGHPVVAGRLIHHSDAGSQYTSIALTDDLALQKIWPSIGSVGDAYDNALIESVNGLYKTECIGTTVFHTGPYRTLSDVEYATSAWVAWYNNDRLHSSIGQAPPAEFESAYYAALNRELHPYRSGRKPGVIQSPRSDCPTVSARPTTRRRKPKACPPPKRCTASNDALPASCSTAYRPTTERTPRLASRPPLDIGETHGW